MPVSTKLKQEAQKLAIPRRDDEMFVREDFDQKRLRYEFAAVDDIPIDQETIKTEDIEVMDPSTLEMPVGPAGTYDDHGTAGGVETIMVDGQEWDTFVYNDGFTWHPDMDSVESVERQRTAIEEMFHFLGDVNFFLGMDPDNDDNNEYMGMFEWLRSSVPSKRVFDCDDYDNDGSGSEAGKPDYTDVPEDLIRGEVIEAVYEDFGGSALDASGGFDLAIGSPTAIHQLEGYSVGATDDLERGPTFMQRLMDADTIQNAFKVPYKLQPDYLHDAAESDIPEDFMRFSMVDRASAVDPSGLEPLGNDEIFLIPDVDLWRDEYIDLREMAAPRHYGPVEEEFTGAEAHGYKWRYGHKWDPLERHSDATDVVHIKNVSDLFGKDN
jgi:hypothetical protein